MNIPVKDPQATPAKSVDASQTHFDVLIVGAGVSGIGAAHHLQEQCPDKSFVLLETKGAHGGTWYTHKYPGVRSDSDLYTFGYRFKPWMSAPIAEAGLILDYMGEVIEEDNLDNHIRYHHKVTKAEFHSALGRWTIHAIDTQAGADLVYTADFLFMCQGYYDHDNPYTPDWDGMNDYKGQIIHPQLWPEDLDYKGKTMIVIGSGATAATIVPAMADDAAHITLLQRSPTYFWTGENRNELADQLRALDIPDDWTHEIVRRQLLAQGKDIQNMSKQFPDLVKEELLKVVREQVGDDKIVEEHFTPSYRPWQQRLAFVPDGDLFKAVKAGKVDVVTDHIDRFTEKGILLKSGKELEADIIVTATGFNLLVMGGIPFEVDGKPVDFSKTFTYRGLMLEGVPNMAHVFGYFRTSWTMRADLICDYVCRLLNHMDQTGAKIVTPTLRAEDQNMTPTYWVAEEEFNPGYMMRGRDKMPKNGDHEPWQFPTDYYVEKDLMPNYPMDDEALVYG